MCFVCLSLATCVTPTNCGLFIDHDYANDNFPRCGTQVRYSSLDILLHFQEAQVEQEGLCINSWDMSCMALKVWFVDLTFW